LVSCDFWRRFGWLGEAESEGRALFFGRRGRVVIKAGAGRRDDSNEWLFHTEFELWKGEF